MTSVSDFDFALPDRLIAQEARPRGESRMMVVDRRAGTFREASIRDLPALLAPGDLLVVNDTRVFPARLIGRRVPSGGAVECLLLAAPDASGTVDALVHPGQKLKPGARVLVEDPARAPGVRLHVEILALHFFGRRTIALTAEGAASVEAAIDALGHVPLPPYIHRADVEADRARYQTVYARERGSVAAPTAGLHFDEALLAALDARGVERAAVTLHVGYGTFKPVRSDVVEEHAVDPEPYVISDAAASAIRRTRARGGRVVAVGTTSVRALESAALPDRTVRAGRGDADLFIHPGHTFGVVDALLTNLHLPRSSLLMLVAAFGGRELVLDAYREAVAREFHFYSYGDAMLIV